MGFRIIELFILAMLIVFIVNVVHYFLAKDCKDGGIFFLSKMWSDKDKGKDAK